MALRNTLCREDISPSVTSNSPRPSSHSDKTTGGELAADGLYSESITDVDMGSHGTAPGPIAIVGLSCKFAGDARSPEAFWQMLAEKRSAWSAIPSSRFNARGSYHPDAEKPSTMNVKGGYFIDEDPALFDAGFFSLSSETAATLDPQFRFQLESVYEALENAGVPLAQIRGSRTSVYAGLWVQDYRDSLTRDEDNMPKSYATGTGSAFAANRISHFFDFRGASMTIDTGCSTTLVALHQAVQALRNEECDMAVVGGSNIMLNPDTFKTMSSASFLSADGKSYAFDSRANGYGRGDGVATIVVKRLEDALAANDAVRAVIRETSLNQDGKTDSITSPSQTAQIELMQDCYRKAALDPRDTHYFEAHGTGTATGDPIEAGAVATVFRHGRSSEQPLLIGSVKTNIGHTEVASGLASIVKVALAMEKGTIPASINFEQANPRTPLQEWGLKLVRDLEEWPVCFGGVKRASINNFGYGGTNAHLIMESGDAWRRDDSAGRAQSEENVTSGVLILSAKSEHACQNMLTNVRQYLVDHKEIKSTENLLQDILYTLGQRRSMFQWIATQRLITTSGSDEAASTLSAPQCKPFRVSRQPRIGMVFTGQGAQWHAMGRDLMSAYPVYMASLQEADTYLGQMGAEWSLLEELHRDATCTRVNDTNMSIPICVAVQIALLQLLRTWAITPAAVTSHSSGEIAAAYAVGALDLKSAMAVAYHRATLTANENLRRTTKGAMVAVGVGIDSTTEYLEKLASDGTAVAACINSPSSVTVSGDLSAVQEVEDMMKADGIFARRLRVDAAYHSHHMDPIAQPYREALLSARLRGPISGDLLPVAYSTPVTGDRVFDAAQLTEPDHWVESMIKPVRFVDALVDMLQGDFDPSGSSVDVILEVGPHSALGGGIKEILQLPEFHGIQLPYYACLLRNVDATKTMQDLVCNLLREGCTIDLAAVNFPRGKPSSVRVLTDMPSYPWDHRTRYWRESRFNRAIRNRPHPPHALLGSLASWANPAAPTWRHILRIDDSSWLRDHIVQSSIVYPGAGFICLAVEAVAQMEAGREDGNQIVGFCLRDVDLQLALIVPDNAIGIEIQTTLTPVSDKAIGSKGWVTFEVASVTAEGVWTHHAQGLITAEFGGVHETSTKVFNHTLRGYARRFDPDDFYANLRSIGMKHGPLFRNMKSITQSSRSSTSVATFAVADTNAADSLSTTQVLHPTTLDSIFQAAYTALPGAGSGLFDAKVPRSIGKLWVSNKIKASPGHRFEAWSSLGHVDAQDMQASISVIDHGNDGKGSFPVLEIEDLVFQSLGRGAAQEQSDKGWEKEVCNTVRWAPDLSLATPALLQSLKQQLAHSLDPGETHVIEDLRRVCIYFIQDALTTLRSSEAHQLEDHQQKYVAWLQSQLELAIDGRLGPGSANWVLDERDERDRRIAAAKSTSVNGEMVYQLGPHLASMLRDGRPPLELMMQDRLLYRYYSNMLKCSRSFQHIAMLLKHVVHKNPRARILEIGAGTGGGTRHALPALGTEKTGGPLASLYHFTDVSAAFFEAASQEFTEWTDILQLDKLDIEADPTTQGFEEASYDVVIACQVLHATKSMKHTMANVRKLLKPNGTLLMVETTQDQVDVQFVFGLLPGWWLSEEEERHSSPSLSVPFWDRVLKETGFTGIDLEIHDCESEKMYSISTIMSTSAPEQVPCLSSGKDFVIVTSDKNPPLQGWIDFLRDSVGSVTTDGNKPAVEVLETASTSSFTGKTCIFVGEAAEEPLLHSPSPEAFEGLKVMTSTCKGLLWITRGGASTCEEPDFSLATGFLRALRNEHVGRPFLSLDLDSNSPVWSNHNVDAIMKVITTNFGESDVFMPGEAGSDDFEYAERGGVLLVPRIYKDTTRNRAICPDVIDFSKPGSLSLEPFIQASRPLCLQIGVPGSLETLAFGDDKRPCIHDTLANSMVEIEPRAYGVNFRDVMVAMGQLEERRMGMECAGVITKVGTDAASQGLAIGDQVMCLLRGPFASRVCVERTSVVRMIPGLSFEEAASIPLVFTTAYYSLVEVARLKRGQTILIHAAAGGVGQAAIMLAQHLGANIFATVGSPEKQKLLLEKYGIPLTRIFSSRNTSFAKGVLAATDGVGVDVVLNSLAGPLLQASFDVIAPFGHFVEIGKRDLERNSNLEMRPFARHASFSSVDILAMQDLRRDDTQRLLANLARLLADKAIAPVQPLTVLPLRETEKAFRLLQAGKHSGKVVLSVGPQCSVPTLPRQPKVRLSEQASYLLVGGVGGVGRSIANWMVEHGAKYLILLSRTAGDAANSGGFVDEMQEAGCRVKAINCDVGNAAELGEALHVCEQEHFPPVRGIVQGAMVLKDAVFERMTLDEYNAAVRPKVIGTWNVHSHFPQANDLDFFILLSSNVGIMGNAGQANYAAGGTYQDALAQWRVARNLPCVSIDLAAVKSVGYVAETTGVWARMAKLGHMSLEEGVVCDLLESAILTPLAGQIVAGINGKPGVHWDRESSSQLGRDSRFMALRHRQQQQGQKLANRHAKGGGEGDSSLASQLAEAASRAEAERLVAAAITQKLADIFTIPVDDINVANTPGSYGVDSLVAVELRNMLTHKAGSEISSFSIMQSTSLQDLAKEVVAKSRYIASELS